MSHFLRPHTPSLLLQPVLCLTPGLSLPLLLLCPEADVTLHSHPLIKAVDLNRFRLHMAVAARVFEGVQTDLKITCCHLQQRHGRAINVPKTRNQTVGSQQ